MKVKIFGERNTATNALKQMIIANSDSFVHPGGLRDFSAIEQRLIRLAHKSALSTASIEMLKDRLFAFRPLVKQWKHCATNFTDINGCAGTHFVFVVRHPASWLLSLYKNPYQRLQNSSDSLKQFMETEWRTLGREKLDGRSFRPLELYEEKIASYIRFIEQLNRASLTHSLIRFEDMILQQEACHKKLSPYLERPSVQFVEVQKSTKDKTKSLDYYKDYYGNERWKNELNNELSSMISFDAELLEWMGYVW